MNFLVELCVSSMSTMIAIAYLLVFYVIMGDGLTVTINTDVTGIEGSKGTYIQCMFNKEDDERINFVYIQAFRNTSFVSVVTFVPDRTARILPLHDYLYGRVALTNITQSSTEVKLVFHNLLCFDDTDYRCFVNYVSNDGIPVDVSSHPSMHIHVKVLPSKPNFIEILNTAQSSHEGTKSCKTKLMGCISSPPEGSIKNESNCRKHDNHNSRIMFLDGDMISIVCQGNIGKPPGDLIVQMIRTTGEIFNLTTINNATCAITNKCTFHQRSLFTVNVTYADNGAVFRCAVKSMIYTEKMYIQSIPINEQSPDKPTSPETSSTLYLAICGACGGGGAVGGFVIMLIRISRKRRRDRTTSRQKQSKTSTETNTLDSHAEQQRTTSDVKGADNYSYVSNDNKVFDGGSGADYDDNKGFDGGSGADYDDNKGFDGGSGAEYVRLSQEESKQNESKEGHKSVEYTLVKNPQKHGSNQQSDDSCQPTANAQVTKVKCCISLETPYEDPYESGDGIYDKTHDRRHKKIKESEPFDKTASFSRRSDKSLSNTERSEETIKQKQVAKVKPPGHTVYENPAFETDDAIETKRLYQ